jgi:hypothetical protein
MKESRRQDTSGGKKSRTPISNKKKVGYQSSKHLLSHQTSQYNETSPINSFFNQGFNGSQNHPIDLTQLSLSNEAVKTIRKKIENLVKELA